MVKNKQITNRVILEQSLLFTSEKAIFCQKKKKTNKQTIVTARPATAFITNQWRGGQNPKNTNKEKCKNHIIRKKQTKQQPSIPPIELGIKITNFNQLRLYLSTIMIIIPSPKLVWESGRRHAQTSTLLLACTNVVVQVFR